MRRPLIMASVALLVSGLLGNNAGAQPVTTFAEVAGNWTGVGSQGGKSNLEIQPNGNFKFDTRVGMLTGLAKIDRGMLVLPYSNNQGQQKFTKTGDVLEGPYVYGLTTGTTRMTRVNK